MAEDRTTRSSSLWSRLGQPQGDKVLWIDVCLLIMISIIAISSSTSLLALQAHSSRLSFAGEQALISLGGLTIIYLCYKFGTVGVFRVFSMCGFALSLLALVFLASHYQGIPFLRPIEVNNAWRVISVFGVQLHVFECVKVGMVMYIAWAMDAIKTGRTSLADRLAEIKLPAPGLTFLKGEDGKTIFYVILPIGIIFCLVALGSLSSACFIGLIMGATAILGGLKMKHILRLLAAGTLCLGVIMATYSISDGRIFNRIGTGIHRVSLASSDPLTRLHECASGPGSKEFQEILDETMQPVSAKVAISEGGFFGKGPGNSTQRYKVAIMYEDFMFSFIVEEYGIFGAFLVMLIYGSLLARGALLVKNCENHYARTMISGLVLLIAGQAMMHIFINIDVGLLTGQTLPMISHGNSSFLVFSFAFGILLSMSKLVKKKMDKAAENAEPIIVTESENTAAQEG